VVLLEDKSVRKILPAYPNGAIFPPYTGFQSSLRLPFIGYYTFILPGSTNDGIGALGGKQCREERRAQLDFRGVEAYNNRKRWAN